MVNVLGHYAKMEAKMRDGSGLEKMELCGLVCAWRNCLINA